MQLFFLLHRTDLFLKVSITEIEIPHSSLYTSSSLPHRLASFSTHRQPMQSALSLSLNIISVMHLP